MHKYRKIFSFVLIGFLLLANGGLVQALEMSESEARKIFWERMGRRWSEASDKEKKIFLRSLELAENKKNERENGESNSNDGRNTKQVVGTYAGSSFAVRYKFEQEKNIKWEEAGEEEKKEFYEKYKKDEEKRNKAILKKQKQREKSKEKYKKAREREKKNLEKKRKQREKAKQRKLKEKRKKQKESQKKMKKAKKKLEKLRKKANR